MIEYRNVSKAFGGVQAVSELSFDVNAGSIHGLIGPNGAGKTTSFNMISGMLRPDAGSILFNGQLITSLRPQKRAALGIARTFQHVQLIPDATVLENVTIGCHLRGHCGIAGAIFRLPQQRREESFLRATAMDSLTRVGMERHSGVLAGELAYGQQRYVELARAIAMNPSLLLLDEPAAGLNDAETDALGRLIKTLKIAGMTILLVEHAMALVLGICDTITVLDFGRKIAEGSPFEIRANPAVIEAYLGTPDIPGGAHA